MKKILLLIFICICGVILFLEQRAIKTRVALVIMNITHDTRWVTDPDILWITQYNQAIWLTQKGQYEQARQVIESIGSDVGVPYRAERLELSGDLLFVTSGSLDRVLQMYEGSLVLESSSRVAEKIAWIRSQKKSSSSSSTQSGTTASGVQARELQKKEIQEIAKNRAQYLSNAPTEAMAQSELQRLVQESRSEVEVSRQDW